MRLWRVAGGRWQLACCTGVVCLTQRRMVPSSHDYPCQAKPADDTFVECGPRSVR